MRKYILAAMLLILTSGAFAQIQSSYSDGQNHVGFNIGYSDAILRERTSTKDTLNDKINLQGLKVGMVYETNIIKGFGVQFGLNYTFGTKLGKTQGSDVSTVGKKKDDLFYHQAEMTIDWQYKFEVAKETYMILYTGPTVEAGIGYYKKTLATKIDPVSKKPYDEISRINFYKQMYSDNADPDADGITNKYNRLNIAWGVGAGFQYQRYFIRGSYDFGIYNPYHDRIYNNYYSDGSDYRYRGRLDQWSIKIGMYLWQF